MWVVDVPTASSQARVVIGCTVPWLGQSLAARNVPLAALEGSGQAEAPFRQPAMFSRCSFVLCEYFSFGSLLSLIKSIKAFECS